MGPNKNKTKLKMLPQGIIEAIVLTTNYSAVYISQLKKDYKAA